MSHKDFSDAEHLINNTRGVLDGDAFQAQERVTDKVADDGSGIDFTCHCQLCGRRCIVQIPWPELIVASVGVTPADMHTRAPWGNSGGVLFPNVRCPMCTNNLVIPVTPDKAMRLVQQGIQARRLHPQQVAQMQAQAQGARR